MRPMFCTRLMVLLGSAGLLLTCEYSASRVFSWNRVLRSCCLPWLQLALNSLVQPRSGLRSGLVVGSLGSYTPVALTPPW